MQQKLCLFETGRKWSALREPTFGVSLLYCKNWLPCSCLEQARVSARSAQAFPFPCTDFLLRFLNFWLTGRGKCPLSGPFCSHLIVWKLTAFHSAQFFDDLQPVSASSAVPFFIARTDLFMIFLKFCLAGLCKCPLNCPIFFWTYWFPFAFSNFWITGLCKCPLSVPLVCTWLFENWVLFLLAYFFRRCTDRTYPLSCPVFVLQELTSVFLSWAGMGKCPLRGLFCTVLFENWLLFLSAEFSTIYSE